jgi:hypothetical protein
MWWLILGVIIGAGGWWLVAWTRKQNLRVTWYEWALAVLAVVFALLAIQNYFASVAELEAQAGAIMLALFGVPALILAAIAWFLVWRRQKSAPAPKPAKG